jgi:hypothetical protein
MNQRNSLTCLTFFSSMNLLFWFIATIPIGYRIKKIEVMMQNKERELSGEELVKNKKCILLCFDTHLRKKCIPRIDTAIVTQMKRTKLERITIQ